MNRDQKALLYDDLVREGDRINRQLSKLKSNVNPTPAQEKQIEAYKNELAKLEARVNQLFND